MALSALVAQIARSTNLSTPSTVITGCRLQNVTTGRGLICQGYGRRATWLIWTTRRSSSSVYKTRYRPVRRRSAVFQASAPVREAPDRQASTPVPRTPHPQHRGWAVYREVNGGRERPAERGVVVAMAGQHVRLDQREVRQGARRGVLLELGERNEMGDQPVP